MSPETPSSQSAFVRARKALGRISLFSAFLSTRVIASVVSLVTLMLITRSVSIETVGIYAAAMGVAALLSLFLDLGSTQILVREVAERNEVAGPIHAFVRTRIYLTFMATLLAVACSFLLLPSEGRAAGLAASAVVFFTFANGLIGIGQVLGSVSPYRNATLAQALVTLIATAVLLHETAEPSAAALVACGALGGIVATAYACVVIHRAVGLGGVRAAGADSLKRLQAMAVLGTATALGSVYVRIDGVILLGLGGASAAAIYGIALKVIDQARMVPTAAMLPLGPFLSTRVNDGQKLPADDRKTLSSLSFHGGLALGVAIVAVADLAVLVLGGPRYSEAVEPLCVLAVSMSLAGFVVVATLECIMSGAERVLLIVAALAAVFNITLNLIFIPVGGANAAAATTVATELFVFAALMIQLDRKHLLAHCGKAILIALLVGAAAAAQLGAIALGVGASAVVSILLLAAIGRSIAIALRQLAIVSDGAKFASDAAPATAPVPGL